MQNNGTIKVVCSGRHMGRPLQTKLNIIKK